MTITTNMRNTLSAAVLGMAIIVPQQASAGLLNSVYSKANAAYVKASQTLTQVKVVKNVVNSVNIKIDNMQAKIDAIPAKLDALPDPAFVLGNARNFIEDNVIRVTDELDRVRNEFQTFKGDGCNSGSPCGNLRDQLLAIHRGLNGIKDTLPGYDILPSPSVDPKEIAIQNLPPMVLFGLNSLTGPLDGLDRMEALSQWVDGLRFYALRPIEEDDTYRLPVAECNALESSINTDNEKFNDMKDIMGKVEIVTHLMQEIMPKDIVINAWVGTSIPNPALPVAVFMNKISSDFDELLEKELEARKEQVKGCRTQAFRTAVLDSMAR